MANFFVSYDLNGSTPSHKQVDEHLAALGAARGRVLETVWYVGWSGSCRALFDHVNSIMSNNDRLMVWEASNVVWRNTLTTDDSLLTEWNNNR